MALGQLWPLFPPEALHEGAAGRAQRAQAHARGGAAEAQEDAAAAEEVRLGEVRARQRDAQDDGLTLGALLRAHAELEGGVVHLRNEPRIMGLGMVFALCPSKSGS